MKVLLKGNSPVLFNGESVKASKNQYIFVSERNFGWCVGNEKVYELLSKIQRNPLTVSELRLLFGKSIDSSLYTLFRRGVVVIDGKTNSQMHRYIRPKNLTIVLSVTYRCNLSCEYCYAAKREQEDITLPIALKAIELFRSSKQPLLVVFHGGEPLLKRTLIQELVETYSNVSGIYFGLQTNGTLINDKFITFIKQKGIKLSISIDGPPSINDQIRIARDTTSSTTQIIKNTRILKKKKVPFNVIVVLTKKNLRYIPKTIDFLVKIGATGASFNPVMSCTEVGNKLVISPIEYFQAQKTIYDKTRSLLLKGIYFMPREIQEIAWKLFYNFSTSCLTGPCNGGDFVFHVSPNGDIYPCCRIEHPLFRIGNVISISSFKDLKRENKFPDLRKTRININDCKNCVWQHFCMAGCPSEAFFSRGSFYRKTSFCDYYKRIYPHLMYVLSMQEDMKQHLLMFQPGRESDG